jgi:hypothetical protein
MNIYLVAGSKKKMIDPKRSGKGSGKTDEAEES